MEVKRDLEALEKQELDIKNQIQKRLPIHLDLLRTIQETILDGIDLMNQSSQRIDFDDSKGRLQLLSVTLGSRVIAVVRSSVDLFLRGYALEAGVLARSLFEISVIYEYLADNPSENELFLVQKISPTEVVKRAIRQNRNSESDDDYGLFYGMLSDLAHHSQWTISHTIDWEIGERIFAFFRVLVEDSESIDPILRQIFYSAMRFYNKFYEVVTREFATNDQWQEDHDFILEFQDILSQKTKIMIPLRPSNHQLISYCTSQL